MSTSVQGSGGGHHTEQAYKSGGTQVDSKSESGGGHGKFGDYQAGGNNKDGAGKGTPSDWMGSQGPSKEEVSIYKADKHSENHAQSLDSKEKLNSDNNSHKLALEDKKNESKSASEDKKYQAEADRDSRKAELEKGKQEHALKLDEQNHKQELEKLKLQQDLKNKDDVREHEQHKELSPERDKERLAKLELAKMSEDTKRYEANQAKQASKHG
jgi:hypothetical protein